MPRESQAYLGFPPLPPQEEIIQTLVYDQPERRWQMVRALSRLADPQERQELIEALQPYLEQVDDFRIRYRLLMALKILHHPFRVDDYVLVAGKGAWRLSELEDWQQVSAGSEPRVELTRVIDVHIHPKSPDLKFFADLQEAGISHAVILATDTDPADVDRPEIRAKLEANYSRSALAHRLPFPQMLRQIRASLYSPTHVTNLDVADWVQDYPDRLIGFGSVNLSKSRDYVAAKIEEVHRLGLRGFKLLPYSQFFNPAENDNIDLLFDYCRQEKAIVLTHTGCGAGPFELLELSGDTHPNLWEPVLQRYPEVPVILAHFGAYSSHVPGIWLYEALQLGKKYPNVYADLAAVDWILDREMVVKEIRKTIGFDRVLFGSDYPLPLSAGISLTSLVRHLRANKFMTDKEKCKVLWRNAARLLRLDL